MEDLQINIKDNDKHIYSNASFFSVKAENNNDEK